MAFTALICSSVCHMACCHCPVEMKSSRKRGPCFFSTALMLGKQVSTRSSDWLVQHICGWEAKVRAWAKGGTFQSVFPAGWTLLWPKHSWLHCGALHQLLMLWGPLERERERERLHPMRARLHCSYSLPAISVWIGSRVCPGASREHYACHRCYLYQR